MQVLEIKGKKWLTCVDWEILPGDNPVKIESKEVANKTNNNYGIICEYDDVSSIGLMSKNAKEPSIALYFSLANQHFREHTSGVDQFPDWIAVEEIEDEKYLFLVSKSGVPAPQFDNILDITSVKEKLSELLLNDTFTVFTNSGEIINIFEGLKFIENKSLSSIVESVDTKIRPEKLRGIPMIVIYICIGVMVFISLIFGILQFMEGRDLKEKALYYQRQKEAEVQRKKEEYQQNIKKYFDDSKKNKDAVVNKVIEGTAGNKNEVIKKIYDFVSNYPVGTHGWNMKKIDCYFDIEQKLIFCDFLYTRTGLTTNKMLLEDFPHAILNGNEAVVKEKIHIENHILLGKNLTSMQQVPSVRDWGGDIISSLQLLKLVGVEHEIKESKELTYSLPGKPLSPEETAAGNPPNSEKVESLGVGVGSLIIKSNILEFLDGVVEQVNVEKLGFDKIIFDIRDFGQIAWELKLNYFVNTQETVVKSSNSETVSTDSLSKNIVVEKPQNLNINLQQINKP